MLAIDVMEELAWDDFLSKVGESAYTLNTKGQVQEGTFIRKADENIHESSWNLGRRKSVWIQSKKIGRILILYKQSSKKEKS